MTSSKLFNDTMHNINRIVQGSLHLPSDVARRIGYRVSPAEFDQLRHETMLREHIYYDTPIPSRWMQYQDVRCFGVKLMVDPELTEILPRLKDYEVSG